MQKKGRKLSQASSRLGFLINNIPQAVGVGGYMFVTAKLRLKIWKNNIYFLENAENMENIGNIINIQLLILTIFLIFAA